MWEWIKTYGRIGLLWMAIAGLIFWGRSCRINRQDTGRGEQQVIRGISSTSPTGLGKRIVASPNSNFSIGHPTISLEPGDKQTDRGTDDILRVDGETRSPITWNARTGQLIWDRYGWSFAPGISLIGSKEDYGLGVDFRGLYIGDFGIQLGADFFKHSKTSLFTSVGYNLRRYPILQNTDLVIGIDLNKTVFGGVRVELGRK